MPKLPVLSGRELIKLFEKKGFGLLRQSGSHAQLEGTINSKKVKVTVINTKDELAKGTLNSIIKKQLQITHNDFYELFLK